MKTTPVKVVPKSKKKIPQPQPLLPDTLMLKILYVVRILLEAFVAFLGAQLVAPFVLSIIVLSVGVKTDKLTKLFENNTYMHFVLILGIELLTVWGVSVFLRRKGWKWSDIGLGRKPTWGDAGRGLVTYAVYFVIFMAIYFVERGIHFIDVNQSQQLGFNATHGPELVFVALSLVVLPPIAEEILFRGYMFLGMRKRIPFLQAALITSLLFGIAHLEFGSGVPLNWAAAIDTFTLSCVLTYAVEKNRSLWPNIFVHATKNLVAFILLFIVK